MVVDQLTIKKLKSCRRHGMVDYHIDDHRNKLGLERLEACTLGKSHLKSIYDLNLKQTCTIS